MTRRSGFQVAVAWRPASMLSTWMAPLPVSSSTSILSQRLPAPCSSRSRLAAASRHGAIGSCLKPASPVVLGTAAVETPNSSGKPVTDSTARLWSVSMHEKGASPHGLDPGHAAKSGRPCSGNGVARSETFIYTDIVRDGTLTSPTSQQLPNWWKQSGFRSSQPAHSSPTHSRY